MCRWFLSLPAADDFHARFDAVSREYAYRVYSAPIPSPLNRHFAWHVYGNTDFELLERCAEMVRGEHNFVNFCIPPDEELMTTICTIHKSSWVKEGQFLVYEITGDRFLRHMVRRLVGSMIRVASGSDPAERFEELLTGSEQQSKGFSAPAHGLVLRKVNYPGG
jgi:tRNA pseudouridine38-40 synthase